MSSSGDKINVNYIMVKSALFGAEDIRIYYDKIATFEISDSLVEYIERRHHNSPTKEPIYHNFIDFFRKFTNVVSIMFLCNKYDDLLSEILDSDLPNLRKLAISDTTLQSLPENFGNLSQITEFYIIKTKLNSLPESVSHLSQLTALKISDTNLTSLPESVGHLSKLKYLTVNNTTLTSLPASIINLSQLTTLNLSENRLTSLPERIGNLSKLEYLFVDNNNLTSLPESVYNLPQLVYLVVNNNHLTSLSERIGNLSQLIFLNIAHNNVTSLPESIGNLLNLSNLTASNNNLTALPETIGNLSKLTVLHIKNNRITSLPESVDNLPNLQELSINNSVSGLSEKIQNLLKPSIRRERRNENATENENENRNENAIKLTNNMFIIHNNTNSNNRSSYSTNVGEAPFHTFMPDIIKNLTAMDRLVLHTYSYRGDYFVNKFLSTTIFDTLKNAKNKYNLTNVINTFRHLTMFKKLIKQFPPKNNMNVDEFIKYKQELIYYLFVMTYNTVIRVSKMIREKISWPFTVYRGSMTHYLKDMNTNKFYYFDSFVSTTTDVNIATEFSTDGSHNGPIYVFLIDPMCYYCYLGVGLSRYPTEKEVLLTPYHRYYFMREDAPFRGHEVYMYCVMPPDLEIPTTFDTFLPWKNTVKNLFANKNGAQNGGKQTIISLPRFVTTRKKNQPKKLNRNTRKKNVKAALNMRKNMKHNTQKNTKTTTQKVVYDMERAERWTEPLSSFPGKVPTQAELAIINKIKASL